MSDNVPADTSGQAQPQIVGMLQSLTIEQTIKTSTTNPARRSTYRDDYTEGTGKAVEAPAVSEKPYELSAQDRRDLRSDTINYDAQRMIGHGSFGAVFLARVVETNEVVAIKKVLQDRRFKNRELQIMVQLMKQPHPYVVCLRHSFISKGTNADGVYLNLVLEYVPETIYSVAKQYNRAKENMPILSVKVYMYQLARALAHIHGLGICHRDIKPQNLLVDPARHVLKLCDFGSAKVLVRGEPNVAYICSRYYRAPELIFGSTEYTTAIDVWSQGCVLAELLLGGAIFPGSSGVDQLVEIVKVLGTPTKDELKAMNPNYQEFKFPPIRPQPFASIFRPSVPPEAIDLASTMLFYVPSRRCKAIEACGHAFFDELRSPSANLSDGSRIPVAMFDFTQEELSLSPGMAAVLVPLQFAGITSTSASTNSVPTSASSSGADGLDGASEIPIGGVVVGSAVSLSSPDGRANEDNNESVSADLQSASSSGAEQPIAGIVDIISSASNKNA